MPDTRPFRPTPLPQWPAAIPTAAALTLLLAVVVAFGEGGPCLGGVAIGVAIPLMFAATKVAHAIWKPIAWSDYRRALDALKQNSDPSHREFALAMGRRYARFTANQTGALTYTEMQIQNDIMAASGARLAR